MVGRIKVPDSFYIGVRSHTRYHTGLHSDDTPVGMMAPFGTDRNFELRKQTIDSWLGRGQNNPYIKSYGSFILTNEPLCGFVLNTSKSSNGMCGYYSVRDPRGFDIGISLSNARDLLATCRLDHGEILTQCVYGRSGANMILLPVDSDAYKEAVTFTKLQDDKVSIRSVEPGNRVHLKNGLEAQYLGYLYPIVHTDSGFLFHDKRAHHFRIIDQNVSGLHIVKTVAISKVLDRRTITPAAAETMIAEAQSTAQQIYDGRIRLPYQYFTSMANHLSGQNVKLALEPTNKYAIRDSFQPGRSYSVVGTDDQINFYRSTAFSFERDINATTLECNRVDPTPVLSHGTFTYFYKPAPMPPPPARTFASLFGNDVERKKLDLNMTDWFFVNATLINPHTGTTVSLRLS